MTNKNLQLLRLKKVIAVSEGLPGLAPLIIHPETPTCVRTMEHWIANRFFPDEDDIVTEMKRSFGRGEPVLFKLEPDFVHIEPEGLRVLLDYHGLADVPILDCVSDSKKAVKQAVSRQLENATGERQEAIIYKSGHVFCISYFKKDGKTFCDVFTEYQIQNFLFQ